MQKLARVLNFTPKVGEFQREKQQIERKEIRLKYQTKLLECIRLDSCLIIYTFVNKIAEKAPKPSPPTKASPLYRGTG